MRINIEKTCPSNKQGTFLLKISFEKFDIFNMFAQNIDCGHTLELPHLGESNKYCTCTHNLCLGAKIRKIGMSPINLSFAI